MDGEAAKTLDLSVIDTDEQKLDRGELIDSILYIGIEGDDPDNDLEINIGDIDTDDQKIDEFDFDGTTLSLSIQDDGEAAKTLDLSVIDTDEQKLDRGELIDSILYIGIEGDDPDNDLEINIGDIDTDDQKIDEFDFDGTTLSLSIQDDGEAAKTLDLSVIDTDEQKLDRGELIDSILYIGIEGDDPDNDLEINLGDIDTDEQTLSFDDSNNELSISNGNSVFLDSLDTDRQQITLFDVDGNDNLVISLERGGSKTIDISKFDNFGTDDQKLDRGELIDSIIYIGIEGDDPDNDLEINIGNIDTDDQKIDEFDFDGTTLSLSIQDDGEAAKTLDLSVIDTDEQNLIEGN